MCGEGEGLHRADGRNERGRRARDPGRSPDLALVFDDDGRDCRVQDLVPAYERRGQEDEDCGSHGGVGGRICWRVGVSVRTKMNGG